MLFGHFVCRWRRWWWRASSSSSLGSHFWLFNLFFLFWFWLWLSFYWLFHLFFLRRWKWSFGCFSWRWLYFNFFFRFVGDIRSNNIFLCRCFLLIFFLWFGNLLFGNLWWWWRNRSLFNFVWIHNSFGLNRRGWLWLNDSGYFLRGWWWWRRNFRFLFGLYCSFLNRFWLNFCLLLIISHGFHVCGMFFFFLFLPFFLLLHKRQCNRSLLTILS